jgi:hypothetical protein
VQVPAPPFKSLLRKAGMLSSRRREKRLPCRRAIRILCGFDPLAATLVQCSAHGVAVLSPQAIAAGEQFMIQVNVRAMALLVYTVRHCQPLPEKQFRLGAELVDARVPKGTTLEAIVDALLNPAAENRTAS